MVKQTEPPTMGESTSESAEESNPVEIQEQVKAEEPVEDVKPIVTAPSATAEGAVSVVVAETEGIGGGGTALHVAAANNNIEIAKILLEEGIDTKAVAELKYFVNEPLFFDTGTAFIVAVLNGNENLADIISSYMQ